ncbi:Thioredoxin-disulfide reductase [Neorhizobium galegae bv. officinalis]|uniref:Thioredoxin reductase n=1 Tax=Neorhizobium galegae bv. officinalis TaxID=323656 RepID=A0A0T7FCM1_NEOGA|nr:NAD(P)/FAD-dependent oxidoreductase [Neorhizobium galegae]CDZ32679.1 Thioredoxin-disulfide reductase [Neorhizobium galegae bv. officinalis]
MFYDCAVIGGGPAGLTAAIYLARFHLKVIVLDDRRGRAVTIPLTRNHAGYPDGISGYELVERMRSQATRYGAEFRSAEVVALEKSTDGFVVSSKSQAIRAKTALLATGVVNHRPPMPVHMHDEALAKGLIRYCPVCDGFEVTDQAVGVIGTGEHGFREALFLRSYTADVSLISLDDHHNLSEDQTEVLKRHGIEIVTGPVTGFALHADTITVEVPAGALSYSTIYPALGTEVRSGLARSLGTDCTEEGCVEVDRHQRTTVSGLYAAGDVVPGLDQISHAMGQASVAATAIRNDLSAQNPILRF